MFPASQMFYNQQKSSVNGNWISLGTDSWTDKKKKKRKVGGFRMGFVMSIFHKFLKFYRPNDQENKSDQSFMKVIVTSSPTLLYYVKVDLNLGYMQATHTQSHVTLGPFVSSDHQLHLHHREQEDTHSMSTHCRPGLSTSDGRYGRFDRFLNICAQTYTSLFYPPFFFNAM